MPEYFTMTVDEVRYFVESIKHEYLSKDTYEEATKLISRMEDFLREQEKDDMAEKVSNPT